MPAQTSAPPAPPVSPPFASPTPAPNIAPPPIAPAPADQKLLGGVASGVRSDVLGLPTHKILTWLQSVEVFYWLQAHPNTACLSSVTGQPNAGPQPTGMISPSIYVVYPPVTVYDLCGNTADPGLRPPTTESYPPDALQTLQANPPGAPLTQVFNYADLPCPPPGIADQLDPGAAYNPVLVPPFSIVHRIENTNDTLDCNVNAIKDPPNWVVGVNGINGPSVGPPP
ncbi:MAG: hypothetical protein OHK93_007934 [Ramalina farinacea]|uniref:Uncharacterized protein n=1 Tax=Ramalina farinacea TaxID=258253 RepID=A0AA43QNK9_9LECA|nr:hypothetical protein [Ramalina farinacea]